MIMGGMTVAREDIGHFLRMTRSFKSAAYVGRLFLRHLVDRLSYPRGTRIANGNALVARLALTLFESGQPLWLCAPVTELVRDNGSVTGALVSRAGRVVEVRARRGVVLVSGGVSRRCRAQVALLRARARRQEPLFIAAGNQHRRRHQGGRGGRRSVHRGCVVSRCLDAGISGATVRRRRRRRFPTSSTAASPGSLQWTVAASDSSTRRTPTTISSRR